MINKLTDLAIAESSHATRIFLQWFVTEQVEEEALDLRPPPLLVGEHVIAAEDAQRAQRHHPVADAEAPAIDDLAGEPAHLARAVA